MSEDRQYMGTAADAKSALIEKAKAWRETRQPSMDTAAGHRERDSVERELRFQLANAALLWLWHEENPDQSARLPSLVDREAVARIIDPIAFSSLERSYIVPQNDEFMRMKIARDKADAILALSGTTAERGAVQTALEQARDALIKIRKCSIAGCEEGYGKPEKWADDLFRSHGDVAAALKTIDAALKVSHP